ncbi:MAG TPA: S9 family peptidase [Thermoanaerobaculia bacterium]|nr:S9 family peptidase [Thermoanaerobaculia bacterium]
MPRKNRFLAALPALALAALAPAAAGGAERPGVDALMDELAAVHRFNEVAISPDGSRVAWVEALQERTGAASAVTAISMAEIGSPARRVSAGKGQQPYVEHDLAWSPDGSQLAFLSDQEKAGQLQLYVVPAKGGAVRKVTALQGALTDPHWSPDGKQIALLVIAGSTRLAGPLEAGAAQVGVIEETVDEQRIVIIDVASGRARTVSPADLYVYEFDWAPDGKSFAAIAAHGSGDDNWYVAEVYTITAASGETRSIFKPSIQTQIAVPRFSPDGKTIAFIGGLMSDEPIVGGDVFTVPAAGGEARNLTPDLQGSASWLTWLPSGQILFTQYTDGGSGIARLDPASGRVEPVWSGPESIAAQGSFGLAISPSRDGKVTAVIRQSFAAPPEVWAGETGAWKPLTNANAQVRPAWGEARSLHWQSDGRTVQGWLLFPRGYDAAKRYPLTVAVHGGPAWAKSPAWPRPQFDPAILASEGYFVLFPNPRGSLGWGEAFTKANVKDFGYGDLKDILAGVDEAVKSLPIDPDRIGITGWSYGGFMTMWAVTQTGRFRAAVAGAGLANWQSYYGENGIDQWMIPYFGASVYDDPAVYAKSSPINFVKQVKTPTLVLVGERDVECPTPQSYEFWHALKALGVPTQLVVYPGEGHVFADPGHRKDSIRRTVGWLDRYLKR